MLDGCDADAVLTVLVHKLVEAAREDGAAEGHALLHDWLAILTAQYNRCILGISADTAPLQATPYRLSVNGSQTCAFNSLYVFQQSDSKACFCLPPVTSKNAVPWSQCQQHFFR